MKIESKEDCGIDTNETSKHKLRHIKIPNSPARTNTIPNSFSSVLCFCLIFLIVQKPPDLSGGCISPQSPNIPLLFMFLSWKVLLKAER